jgi:hypothetical protein
VGHQVRGRRADPRQAELLRHRCHDRHRPVCGNGQDTVDPGRTRNRDHGLDLREIDDVRLVGVGQPDRLRVAVDRDDPQSELLGAQDRTPLMAACADEEDALHSAAMLQPHRETSRSAT